MKARNTHDGGCLCGRIRYRAGGTPLYVTNCHCINCRKAAGAAFVTWAVFAAESVAFTTESPAYHESSESAVRGHCPDCGSALTFTYIDGDTIGITVATLDDPAALPPRSHLWAESKIDWLSIDDGLEQYPRGWPTKN